MLGEAATGPDLTRRIATEEAALTRAALVVASSRDEAEVQYGGYRSYDPGRVPCCRRAATSRAFSASRPHQRVDATIDRFLTDPGKPPLLALARPVARKNLAALVRAYGESPELQAQANLVLVAGTREDIDALDGDMAATMRDLLVLIDRYDLYGACLPQDPPTRRRAGDLPPMPASAAGCSSTRR